MAMAKKTGGRGKTSGLFLAFAALQWCAATVVLPLSAADAVGFREIGGTNVVSGTATFEGRLNLFPEATYMKTGAGTLEIPSASIDNAAPYRIDVVGGTLRLTGGTVESPSTVAPAVAQTAAFWVDATDLPDGAVSEWPDKRANGRLARVKNASNNNSDDEVEAIVTNGVKCVSFGGKSGKYMRFHEGASVSPIENIHHFFVVHGVESWWGALLGHWSTPGATGFTYADTYGMVVGDGSGTVAVGSLKAHFYKGGDYGTAMYQARFFLDGRRIDPYTVAPRRNFQLLEGDMLAKPVRLETFFYNRNKGSNAGKVGGDFICEAILFTNKLTEAQRLDVERYLMAKWKLPTITLSVNSANPKTQLSVHRGTGVLRVADGASAEVAVDEGSTSAPFAFEGAGKARKTGDGMMVVGGGAARPFTGDFTIEAGSLLLRGGAMPPVTAASGETYDAARWPTTRPTAAADVTSGVRVARSTGGTAGMFRKTGAGAISVKGITEDAKRIQIEGGLLRLVGSETNTTYDICDTGVSGIEVIIANHSFEAAVDGFDASGTSPVALNSSSNGWYHLNGGVVSFINDAGCSKHWVGYSPPDGSQALLVRGAAYAETDVTIPRAGTYEVSFFVGGRYGIGSAANPADYVISRSVVDVKFADETIGRIHAAKNEFVKHRCRFTVSAADAGKPRRLKFHSCRSNLDCSLVLDDIRIQAVAYVGQSEAVALPNGDFERSDVAGATSATVGKNPFFNRSEVAEGWTFSLLDESKGAGLVNGFVGVVNGGMEVFCTNASGQARNIRVYPYADGSCGASVLCFIGSNGRAEMTEGTSVTLAPGKWRLRAKASMFQATTLEVPVGCGAYSGIGGIPSISASVIRAGVEEPLGSVTPATRKMDAALWPGEIVVTDEEDVRVSLAQTASDGACVVDDLEFVPVSSGEPEVNLFPDYGCETASCWAAYTGDGKLGNFAGVIAAYDNASSPAWGYDCFEGDFALRCRGRGGMKATVNFPAKGLYRLTFHARARADGSGADTLPLRGFVTLSDGSELEVFRMRMPYVQGFQEYSFLFRMTETGARSFGFCGVAIDGTETGDRAAFIDGISIVKVDDVRQSVPEVPADAKVSVASGAQLALDYSGTVKVGALTLGGEKVASGVVSAATHPGFITGMGAIEVRPFKGLMMIIR